MGHSSSHLTPSISRGAPDATGSHPIGRASRNRHRLGLKQDIDGIDYADEQRRLKDPDPKLPNYLAGKETI